MGNYLKTGDGKQQNNNDPNTWDGKPSYIRQETIKKRNLHILFRGDYGKKKVRVYEPSSKPILTLPALDSHT